jgi:UDPglucose 6-dehydrogenase
MMHQIKIGICGLGIVGTAIMESVKLHGFTDSIDLFIYDKYKNYGTFEQLLLTDLLFVALPTPYSSDLQTYDKSEIKELLHKLNNYQYKGIILVKSTVEPQTISFFSDQYKLYLIHNPEFLSAKTAFEDFHHQKHIVLGQPRNLEKQKLNIAIEFYKKYYPHANISICNSDESESMKLFLNSFYSVKIQFFTELYLLCQKMKIDFNQVRSLMLKNGWINPMHTVIPGPDGEISYGGGCFPKDTNALLSVMKLYDSNNLVLEAAIKERNIMR